jgi:hypothetical protein
MTTPGRWSRQQGESFAACFARLQQDGPSDVKALYEDYYGQICVALGFPVTRAQHVQVQVLRIVGKQAGKRGIFGQSGRWMNAIDTPAQLSKYKPINKFLTDISLLL